MKYFIFAILIIPTTCFATSYQPLGEFQSKWCTENGGVVDYVHEDYSNNIACIKDQYAIDVEYANKWKEAVGQALYYSAITGKKPGIALIIQNLTDDKKHVESLRLVANKFNIRVWEIR